MALNIPLDRLANILPRFTPAQLRRGLTDFDRTMERQLHDVISARGEREEAHKCWCRGSYRVLNIQNMIRVAKEELASLEAVEQITREDCYGPILELARVFTSCKAGVRSP